MDAVPDIDRLPAVLPKRGPVVHIPRSFFVTKLEEPDIPPVLKLEEPDMRLPLVHRPTMIILDEKNWITMEMNTSTTQQDIEAAFDRVPHKMKEDNQPTFVLPASFFAGHPPDVLRRYQLEARKHCPEFEICHKVWEEDRQYALTDQQFYVRMYTPAHCGFKKCDVTFECTVSDGPRWLPLIYVLLVNKLRILHLAAAGTFAQAMATE